MILGQPYCISFAFKIFVVAEHGYPNTIVPVTKLQRGGSPPLNFSHTDHQISPSDCPAISDGLLPFDL